MANKGELYVVMFRLTTKYDESSNFILKNLPSFAHPRPSPSEIDSGIRDQLLHVLCERCDDTTDISCILRHANEPRKIH
jgi:hypothetical protein